MKPPYLCTPFKTTVRRKAEKIFERMEATAHKFRFMVRLYHAKNIDARMTVFFERKR